MRRTSVIRVPKSLLEKMKADRIPADHPGERLEQIYDAVRGTLDLERLMALEPELKKR